MSKAEPNVVPLCDVLLVLLIIFMVITPLVQKGIDVKLPETQTDASGGASNVMILTVLKNNIVKVQTNPMDVGLLSEELKRQYGSRQDKTVFIRADSKLPFSKVMEVMDIARGAGIDVIGLVPEFVEED
jgi:biopolymer transport protein TolR